MRVEELFENSQWYMVLVKDGVARVYHEYDQNYLRFVRNGWELVWDSARSPEEGYKFAKERYGALPPGTEKRKADLLKNPQFKKWFRNSRVVDNSGRPLVVYHGTFQDFDAFHPEPNKLVRSGFNRLGYWFDVDPETPNYFAKGNSGNVMPVFLSIQKPLVLDSEKLFDRDASKLQELWRQYSLLWQEFGEKRDRNLYSEYEKAAKKIKAEIDAIKRQRGDDAFDKLMRLLPGGTNAKDQNVDDFVAQAKSEGYDGILLKNTLADDGSRAGHQTDWWIPFDPRQIKSVYNFGSWSLDSDSLVEVEKKPRR